MAESISFFKINVCENIITEEKGIEQKGLGLTHYTLMQQLDDRTE